MFAVAVDKGQLKKVLALVAAVAVLAVVVIAVGGRLMGGHAPDGIPGDTAEKRESYLTSMGLEFSKSSTLVEVAVPEQFDERFAVYNEMPKKAGFDLEPYKGATVQKCTYIVSNRADLGKNVNAVLLVKDGAIVAAHLVSIDDGGLHPLVAAEQTILPADSGTQQTGGEYPAE